MKVLNFGSLNYDYVYAVDHIVAPGETTASAEMETFVGGKGANQSIALARAGVPVYHAGRVGEEGGVLLDALRESGADVSLVGTVPGRSGHAIIQVDQNGQNSILLYGGANRRMTGEWIDHVLGPFGAGDLLVLQNEVNLLDEIIRRAARRGMRIALNPSPFDAAVLACDLSLVSIFLVNEVEGAQISGKTNAEDILAWFAAQHPQAMVVLTLGAEGAYVQADGKRYRQPAIPAAVKDTTAAGDTFTGYFLADLLAKKPIETCLRCAAHASAIAVSRAGAGPSIPMRYEVEESMTREK